MFQDALKRLRLRGKSKDPEVNFTDINIKLAWFSDANLVMIRPCKGNNSYGYIKLDGSLVVKPKHLPYEGLEQILLEISKDIAGYADRYGKKTGVCCFCCTPLTNDISVAVGYGPICASNYGLPYG